MISFLAVLLVSVFGRLVSADTLIIPNHDRRCLPFNNENSSIVNDALLAAELDWLDQFEFDDTSRTNLCIPLECPGCPFAAVDASEQGYLWLHGFTNRLNLWWSAKNDVVNLNTHALLDNNMEDLHQPQTVTQRRSFGELSRQDRYKGPLPITYSSKVVQTRTVRFADGKFAGQEYNGIVRFFSIDFEVLSLDGHDLTHLHLGKINLQVAKKDDGAVYFAPLSPLSFYINSLVSNLSSLLFQIAILAFSRRLPGRSLDSVLVPSAVGPDSSPSTTVSLPPVNTSAPWCTPSSTISGNNGRQQGYILTATSFRIRKTYLLLLGLTQ